MLSINQVYCICHYTCALSFYTIFRRRCSALALHRFVDRDAIALFKRALAQNVEVKDRTRDARLYRALEEGHRRLVDEVPYVFIAPPPPLLLAVAAVQFGPA